MDAPIDGHVGSLGVLSKVDVGGGQGGVVLLVDAGDGNSLLAGRYVVAQDEVGLGFAQDLVGNRGRDFRDITWWLIGAPISLIELITVSVSPWSLLSVHVAENHVS